MLGGDGALPAATAGHRGRVWVVRGGTGVADQVFLCIKTAADTYQWQPL